MEDDPSSKPIECNHSWVPAGHRKNKDRVHNKGKYGKYRAYKCEHCNAFKRRYLK